jgi:integrase
MMRSIGIQGIKLPRVKSDGHHTWTEAEIAQYEAAHRIGTKARLGLALGIYTMQRRGDVVRMGPQHIRDGAITVRQAKTGTTLVIPVLPALQTLDATPSSHLTFLTTRSGQPYKGNDFSEQFRAWCNEAGLPKRCTFHGLRKFGATWFAEAGCSASEIGGGWKSLREVERYTRPADQQRMAHSAMARLKTKTEQPSGKPIAEIGKP